MLHEQRNTLFRCAANDCPQRLDLTNDRLIAFQKFRLPQAVDGQPVRAWHDAPSHRTPRRFVDQRRQQTIPKSFAVAHEVIA